MQNFFLIFTARCAIIKKLIRRCDGIGRRDGLKIRWWRHRVGSSPTTGTNKKGIASAVPFLFIRNAWVGLEGRAAQSNSPVWFRRANAVRAYRCIVDIAVWLTERQGRRLLQCYCKSAACPFLSLRREAFLAHYSWVYDNICRIPGE